MSLAFVIYVWRETGGKHSFQCCNIFKSMILLFLIAIKNINKIISKPIEANGETPLSLSSFESSHVKNGCLLPQNPCCHFATCIQPQSKTTIPPFLTPSILGSQDIGAYSKHMWHPFKAHVTVLLPDSSSDWSHGVTVKTSPHAHGLQIISPGAWVEQKNSSP